MPVFRVFDTETTGFPEKEGINTHRMVEIGYYDVLVDGSDFTLSPGVTTLINPEREISIGAMATHHITQQEVEENGILQSEWPEFIYDDSVDFYVAHNITFDRKFVAIRDDQAICTYKCATWAFEDAESHSNQYLRYYLRLPVVYELCEPPHRALPDAYVTAHILMELLKKFTVDQLIHFTMLPRHIKRFPLGKFYGMELTDPKVDMGYLNWIISKDDMDEDLKHACRNEINRRRGR